MKFRALKPLKVGDNSFNVGDIFYPIDNRDWMSLVRLESAELIDDVKEHVTSTIAQEPVVVKAGPVWKKVMLGDVQLGKSVKTEEEALEIIEEWKLTNGS